jgi:uncharacterized protein involved in exopolysaccharide biosynthesis
MEKDIHLKDYVDVIKRRKYYFIIPAVIVIFISTAVAFLLPAVYKATTTILIEAQEIPEDLVRTTVTGYVEERLQTLSRRILSDNNLMDIAARFALYTDLKDENTTQNIVERLRENLTIQSQTTQVQTDRFSKPIQSTIAFTVSFEGREPEKLAEVANHLANLFLEGNTRDREQKAQTTIEFLAKQLVGLRLEIKETEAQLADFKEKHMNQLPELMQLNLKTMDQAERQTDAQERHIKDLVNRKIYLEGQLALLEPSMHKVSADGKRLLTPKEELVVLQSQYMSLSSSLSEEHPDLIKLKKKLAALEGEVNTRQELRQLRRELYDKEHELALLLKRVSSSHPDAVRLKKQVLALKERVQELSKMPSVLKVEEENPENPAYINVKTRITSTQMEIDAAKRELEQLQEKYEDYRKRIESTPQVEQEYLDLRRNYENVKANYRETADKLQSANEAKGLEDSDMGERFTLITPAEAPLEPYKPNRMAIVLLGMVLAAGAGLGTGSLTEYMDHSVHTAEELGRVAGHKVLTVIPYWETSKEVERKRRRLYALAGSSVVIVVIGLIALNFLYQP